MRPSQRFRSGTIVRDPEAMAIEPTLFGTVLPGSGEVAPLDLVQSVVEAEEGQDPRSLALLVRPERYQERLARQQSDLAKERAEVAAGRAELARERQRLAERVAAIDARQAELDALIQEAAEARVEALAEERLGEDRARLVASVTQLEAVAHGLLDQARLDLLELAVKVAAKVLGAELETRPQLLVGLIRSALESAAPTGQVTLRLNPKDHAILIPRGPQVLGRLPAGIQIALVADERVDRGGVIVSSAAGEVDARIAARLQRVGAQLAELAEG